MQQHLADGLAAAEAAAAAVRTPAKARRPHRSWVVGGRSRPARGRTRGVRRASCAGDLRPTRRGHTRRLPLRDRHAVPARPRAGGSVARSRSRRSTSHPTSSAGGCSGSRGVGDEVSVLARSWVRPGEQHELGLIAFGLALRTHGWRIEYLGADTPLDTIRDVANTLDVDLVVVSAVTPERSRRARPGAATDLARPAARGRRRGGRRSGSDCTRCPRADRRSGPRSGERVTLSFLPSTEELQCAVESSVEHRALEERGRNPHVRPARALRSTRCRDIRRRRERPRAAVLARGGSREPGAGPAARDRWESSCACWDEVLSFSASGRPRRPSRGTGSACRFAAGCTRREGGTLALSQIGRAEVELRAEVTEFVPRLGVTLGFVQRRFHAAISRRYFARLIAEAHS